MRNPTKAGRLCAVLATLAPLAACAGPPPSDPAPRAEEASTAAAAYDAGAVLRTVTGLEEAMNAAVDDLDCERGLAVAGEREPLFVSSGRIVPTLPRLRELCERMVAPRAGAHFRDPVVTGHVLSPTAAYVVRRGDYTVEGKDGSSRTVYLVMTTIWERTAAGWKMVHLHESVVPPGQAGGG